MTLFESVSFALFLVIVHAQDDQSGFISIDCGLAEGSDYTDNITGIRYVSDAGFTETGIRGEISPISQTLRYFPDSNRSCYTLRLKQGKNNTYLIRAKFMYGNYDIRGFIPIFDLYLGTDLWDTIYNQMRVVYAEIIHVPLKDYIKVCLVSTGRGIPFISGLEVRLLDSIMYQVPRLTSLRLTVSDNFGLSDQVIRYKDDKFDRIWIPSIPQGYKAVQTSSDTVPSGDFEMPLKVMSTAITPINSTDNIVLQWIVNIPSIVRIYLHFAEVETLLEDNLREFNIYLNGTALGPVIPTTQASTIVTELFIANGNRFLMLNKTQRSTLPPIINAAAIYNLMQLKQDQTEEEDDAAISNAKSIYGLKRNWQGDPCLPKSYVWDGLTCRYNDTAAARIISLNLSSFGLSGEIATALGNLTMIESLDLSYNNLNGTVPDFLAKLKNLRILNLQGNKFSGQLPPELVAKSKNGSLVLRIGANSDEEKSSCIEGSCKNKRSKPHIGVLVTISVLALLVVFATTWTVKKCRTKDLGTNEERLRTRYQKLKYSKVARITNSFETEIGKGGSGKVFLGLIGGKQVAVKILSGSPNQGNKEFRDEVKFLMDVRHKNITSLIGYCDDINHKAIIYEYMACGNLEKHLFDGIPNVLPWGRRLQIGCDVAEGLAYMHHGCTPPILHRDIKSSNILLNEGFQAKVAGFGLSRAFKTENADGYLDPEYHSTNKLTEKSDVYSFGVVLLELITGKPAILEGINTVGINIAEEKTVEDIIDPRLEGLFDIEIAWKVFELARVCVSPKSNERPSMNEVVIDLNQWLQAERSVSIPLNMESMSTSLMAES
uniref:senescence-induced receptor-like serine/threonine-protein kinase n=1 Tax=Erigeron canadensis TaxID=72917 RepID=UPI001CB989AB|nr:senescence-induced receptor-like serine/threonine-protein kinase [Erigeron canadensis]